MLIGGNGAGKTALLDALGLMFGVTRHQRTVKRSDFYSPHGGENAAVVTRDLSVDVIFSFPELRDGSATPDTIAPSFRHMLIEVPGQAPVCRMRLEAQWSDDQTIEGDVEQNLYWVDTLEPVPDGLAKHRVAPMDRSLVRLYYAPATRDAASQIRATTGALASRLLRAVVWAEKTRTALAEAAADIQSAFSAEDAIGALNSAIEGRWGELTDDPTSGEPRLSLITRDFDEVIRRLAVTFGSTDDGASLDVEQLSDGQQSLFYFALVAAVFDIEQQVVANTAKGFNADEMHAPALSLFALEEPENHLSPYYLSRIMREVRSLAIGHRAQAIMTSHSPAILGRVAPDEVRYLRRSNAGVTSIRALTLPSDGQLSGKYLRGAVLAFPELYFARFVVLVEGESERVILPRLAKAVGIDIDPSFVAIVPLGGRHVQYFWRLLRDLEIPFATLLDLDLGRYGGGYGRLKTIIQRLLEFGEEKQELLGDGAGALTDEALAEMHTWEVTDVDVLRNWLVHLARYNVFFSWPLDLDMAMLHAIRPAYDALLSADANVTDDEAAAARAVLGPKGPGKALYDNIFPEYVELMSPYQYHFLRRSKPATHLSALLNMVDPDVMANMPPELRSLLSVVLASVQ